VATRITSTGITGRNWRPGRQKPDTAQRILDVAEQLVQARGFNSFSYADIAAELGITKAGLHYHYPGKAELGQALITRYSERFVHALGAIDRDSVGAPAKLAAYAKLYADVLRGRRICLCGMLAAEYETLPKPIRDAVVDFFDDNERWLERVLEQGSDEVTLKFDGSARDTARMIFSGLEGAMLVARPYGNLKRFQTTATALLASVTATDAPPTGTLPSE
jgi:TetR/AcrR family transcriptional regulator, transcriptional repressor for nem operon